VASDSFEDLLALQRANPPARDELLELSTLLPTLAEWMAVLGLPRVYDDFRTILAESIPNTDLQLWYPDAMIDGLLTVSTLAARAARRCRQSSYRSRSRPYGNGSAK
jgi:hypothetical protein